MPSLKLIYFDGKGRGEPLRWVLAAAKLPFQEEKFGFEAWPGKKPETPYGSVPILMVDGQPLCQTVAIARYAGVLGGMVSSDPLKNALGDERVDTMAEIVTKIFDHIFEKDEEKKKKDEVALYDELLPKVLGLWESRSSSKFLFCSEPLWQDVFVCHWLHRLAKEFRPDLMAKYPKLMAVTDNVLALEGVKKWVSSEPAYSLPL